MTLRSLSDFLATGPGPSDLTPGQRVLVRWHQRFSSETSLVDYWPAEVTRADDAHHVMVNSLPRETNGKLTVFGFDPVLIHREDCFLWKPATHARVEGAPSFACEDIECLNQKHYFPDGPTASDFVRRILHWTICCASGERVYIAFDPSTGVTHYYGGPTPFASVEGMDDR